MPPPALSHGCYDAALMPRRGEPPVVLPEGTVDLAADVVPAVRALLRRGLPEEFIRSCVRIGAFEAFGGGMKSALVGGLRIDVNAALKLGDAELDLHQLLMERVNKTRARTFPTVESVVKLEDGRRLMFMEQLLGHETLLDLVYRRTTAQADFERILDKVFDGVRAVRRAHREQKGAFRRLPTTADPYGPRLRDRIGRVLAMDRALAASWKKPGEVLGRPIPPLASLLDALDVWLVRALGSAPRSLCHGDLHLANVMARKRGRGFSVRFLDPNPTVGITDPLYDAGKLLHWAEPVGWLVVAPEKCHAKLVEAGRAYRLDASARDVAVGTERRRAFVEASLRRRIASAGRASDVTRPARLHVAIAAAHVGMAALFTDPKDADARRFAFAHALRALAEWHAAVQPI
jgi:hypothetical protein